MLVGEHSCVNNSLMTVKTHQKNVMPVEFKGTDPLVFHRALAAFNLERVAVARPSPDWQRDLKKALDWQLAEGHFLESLRVDIAPLAPGSFPDGTSFAAWFESLATHGPGQNHPLFDWLEAHATMPQMRWFLTQEAAGEAGFEDLLACTQVKLPPQAKLECARNYWDEMGHGKESAMHGQMLERMVRGLDLKPAINDTVWESLALSNAMLGLALTRRYTYQSLGALGVIELTAPARVKKVSGGMRRLGLDGRMRAYFDLHAALDVSHARAWIREIIRPLVDADPTCAPLIAEGALMRLYCGARCFDRYSVELQAPLPAKNAIGRTPAGARATVPSC
jgi:pyrroloquinoline quinone (PQQ) biosynthesis protein C